MKTVSKSLKRGIKICMLLNIFIIFTGLLVMKEGRTLSFADDTSSAIELTEEIELEVNISKASIHESYKQLNYTEPSSTGYKITTLMDLPINFNFSRKYRMTHKILWYNLPPWKNIHRQNNYLPTCEVNNCFVTDDKNDVMSANAIIFVPTVEGMDRIPPVSRSDRSPSQVWIFYSLEPPMNFRYQGYKSPGWLNTMNWSMTYRFDSDIFAPYGTFKIRKHAPKRDYRQLYLQKTKMAAWVVSHCGAESQRDDYVRELEKHGVEVDIFGKCGNSGFMKDGNMNDELNKYKFFIAFENSFCKEYISCKVFRKYNLDLILIVRGGANYSTLMPEGTYINTADFPSVKDLAQFLLKLGKDQVRYIRMLKKKDKYVALDEDEFGEKYAMCELCRKLNNLDIFTRSYRSMRDFLEDRQCWRPKDLPNSITKAHFLENSQIYIK